MEYGFLYRDATLPETFVNKYVPGTRILERGFTDSSKLRGGPNGNVRYLILSNQGRDLSVVDENARKWGLVVFQNGTIFNVLDTYTQNGVTQILLTTESKSDSDLIEAARNDFEALLTEPPVPELTAVDWTGRVTNPLGLDDNGNPFPLV